MIEFCDPANPQFLPVVAVESPVTLAVAATGVAKAGADVSATLTTLEQPPSTRQDAGTNSFKEWLKTNPPKEEVKVDRPRHRAVRRC